MKKIVFCLQNLDFGGIETAFLNLCQEIDYDKYQVSVVLEKKEGVFLEKLDKRVNIIDYNISTNSNLVIRKITNRIKLIKFILLNYHQYDFAACFASSRKVGSILARYLSKNNCLWIHGNYYETKAEGEKFLNYVKALKYKKIVFVSCELKNNYLKIVPDTKQKLYVFNNIIDFEKIKKLSNEEKIEKFPTPTFCHIARHKEDEKNIYMLLSSLKIVSDKGLDFKVYMVGDGPDHMSYIKKCEELNLTDKVIFVGSKANPYPYLKVSDAILLSSKKEGNPVVFLEAKVMNVPIITTNVSDSMIDIEGKYGIVTNCNSEDFALAIENFLEKGFVIKEAFDSKKYNQEILAKLDKVIGDEIEN